MSICAPTLETLLVDFHASKGIVEGSISHQLTVIDVVVISDCIVVVI